jgi:hypothetical protein
VTFLFTDVEGSTRRWEADAEGMRVALAAHDEVLREAIEAHGGWLFKHTGDGVAQRRNRRSPERRHASYCGRAADGGSSLAGYICPELLKLCGAKGIRTPDLLDANESRYQLRHSP